MTCLLPEDVVREIAELSPDPRPLLLSCSQFYRVFTEMPDIAYWCSGRDPQFLITKQVTGGVWTGRMIEIIKSDNLEIFKHLHLPEYVEIYWGAACSLDAGRICRFLMDEYQYTSADFYHAGERIMREMPTLDPIGFRFSTMKLLYKYTGRKVSIHLLQLDPEYEVMYTRGDTSHPYNIQSALFLASRSDFRPPVKLNSITTIDALKEYLQIYGKKLTILLAIKLLNLGRLSPAGLINMLTADLDTEPIFILRMSPKISAATVEDFTFLRARNIEYECPITRIYNDLSIVEYYLQNDLDSVKKYLLSGANFPYSRQGRDLCAKYGVELAMTSECIQYAKTWEDVLDAFRERPDLLTAQNIYKWVSRSRGGRVEKFYDYIKDIQAFPNTKPVVEILLDMMDCKIDTDTLI